MSNRVTIALIFDDTDLAGDRAELLCAQMATTMTDLYAPTHALVLMSLDGQPVAQASALIPPDHGTPLVQSSTL